MLDRTEACFGLKPQRLSADSAYGSAEILAWMVEEKNIAPHVPVWDKGARTDGTFSRSDFVFDPITNIYTCPGGKILRQYRRPYTIPRTGVTNDNMRLYRARQSDCETCALNEKCCPGQPHRKVPRSVREAARDLARGLAGTPEYLQSRRERKKVEMLFAHLKRILRLNRLRLRGPSGAQDEFLRAAVAQNLRKLAKLVGEPMACASSGSLR
jgi:hypothetical protein